MKKFAQVGPDSPDVRRPPLIPALVLMTVTPLTIQAHTTSFTVPYQSVRCGPTTPKVSEEGFSLFMREELEKLKKKTKKGVLARFKEISLPDTISNLPDETLEFLERQGIEPDFVNGTVDGSLMIEFHSNAMYHMVEFYPDGDIVFLKRGSNGKDAWDLTKESYFSKLKEEILPEPQAELVE